jgi:hypothetical protein
MLLYDFPNLRESKLIFHDHFHSFPNESGFCILMCVRFMAHDWRLKAENKVNNDIIVKAHI